MRIELSLTALPTIFLSLCLIPAFGAAATRIESQASAANLSAEAEEKPDAGSVSGNVYRNQFFGFTYQFPEGWMVSQAKSNSGESRPPAEPKGYTLLFAFQYHNLPEISTIMVRAVKLSSPDVTAKQLLLDEYPKEEKRGAKPEGKPQELSIGGWHFFSANFRAKVGGGIIREEYLVTIQKGFAIAFYLISNQESAFKAMRKTMQSLTLLDSAASPSPAQKSEPPGR